MQRWRRLGLALVAMPLLLVPPASVAAEQAAAKQADGLLAVPALARVVDQAGVLAPADRAALEDRLARFESDNGAQVAIVIVPSTGVEPIEDFANRVGSAWKIGRRGVGDGLLLVLATQDRRARIEVARSLEGAIPDAVAKRVIQQSMAPHLKAGDYAGGLAAALDELLPRIGQERLGGAAPRQAQAPPAHGPGMHQLLLLFLLALVFGTTLRRLLGVGGPLIAAVGAGVVTALLGSIALALLVALAVFVVAMSAGRAVGGPAGILFPGSSGRGFGGGGFGGGGGFSSGGGGDFSGGGASGSW